MAGGKWEVGEVEDAGVVVVEGGDERRCGGCSTSRERAVKEKMWKRAAAWAAKSDGARPQVVFRSFQEVYLSAATCNFNFGSARCRPVPRAQPFGTPFRPAPFGTLRGNMKLRRRPDVSRGCRLEVGSP